MKVYQGIEQFKKLECAVVTTGTFDGVHIGHRTILNRVLSLAKKVNGESVLMTFYPHPRMVLQPDSELKLLNTIDEKIALLKKSGIDHLIIHPFTKSFSRLSSMEFIRDLVVNQIGTKHLVIGYDHHFGRNREGTFDHLVEFGPLYGFEVEEIPALEIDEVNVSSTKIRRALLDGDVKTANQYLGHPFLLGGRVEKGKQLGRTLGFPTANLALDNPFKLIPENGVYAVRAFIKGKTFHGILNIGLRPTLNETDKKLSIEVHLFDFNQEIYGSQMQVEFIDRIRSEKKFDSLDELKSEMEKDRVRAMHILK